MDTNPATDDSTVISEPCKLEVGCYGDFQPSWSPDGTRIAFVSSRPGADGTDNRGYQLYVMDALGEVGPLADATRLTADLPDDTTGKMIANSQVTWAPDGRRIAFLSTGRGENPDACDLWVMQPWDRDNDGFGDNLQRLTFDDTLGACDAFENVTPQWSPNSNLIAFTSVRSGYYDIWIVNADDPTDLRNVTQTPTGYEDQPGWSPDGTRIIFRSSVSGAYQIYSLPVPPPSVNPSARPHMAAMATAAPTRQQVTYDRRRKQQADWGSHRAAPGTRTLSVTSVGPGYVRSAAAGIFCGTDCAATVASGRKVQLTATARAGAVFRFWSGACFGVAGPICTVTMDKTRGARATFAR